MEAGSWTEGRVQGGAPIPFFTPRRWSVRPLSPDPRPSSGVRSIGFCVLARKSSSHVRVLLEEKEVYCANLKVKEGKTKTKGGRLEGFGNESYSTEFAWRPLAPLASSQLRHFPWLTASLSIPPPGQCALTHPLLALSSPPKEKAPPHITQAKVLRLGGIG